MHLRHRNLQNKQASIIVWSRAEPWLLRKACGLYGVERETEEQTPDGSGTVMTTWTRASPLRPVSTTW
ncbi:hypothetical protein CGCSCA5_v011934 [Colletotrichum siamense]|nr:hypothetical protein CGCSCA5_v011934 [Colletotrichum siamense]KAF4837999.1 hypothetical protein CGCTS75_v001192 [Colletotrichum tropicale]